MVGDRCVVLPRPGAGGRPDSGVQRVEKLAEKEEEKKKKRKKADKTLEEGEIRNKREDNKERKRASLDQRTSPIEPKRKKEDDKAAKRRSEGEEFREVKEKRRTRPRDEDMEYYDEMPLPTHRYVDDFDDWEREQRDRPATKDKHRSRMENKRR